MKFEIDAEQMKKINEWKESLDQKTIAKQKETMTPEDFSFKTMDGQFPYTGAIGGSGLTYSFSFTSLGIVTKVHDFFSDETLDLTDYDSW